MSRRFTPAELVDPGAESPSDPELASAAGVGRELEARRGGEDVRPSAGFTDRVMAAVAAEPPPARAGLWPRRWSPAQVLASVGTAWSIAVGGGRPIGARAAALAYVLVAVLGFTAIGGAAAIGAAGALGVFDAPSADPSQPPPSLEPSRSAPPASLEPSPSLPPSATPAPVPSESVEPSLPPSAAPPPSPTASPDETDEPEASDDATASPSSDPSDEPDSSDDHSGSSPDPSETPKPSGTDETD